MENACRIIIDDILDGKINNRRELEVEKRQLCRNLKLKRFMSNADILEFASPSEREDIQHILRKKPSKFATGVGVVAVMCHPHDCPHGRCFYCPESDVAPPSYTGEEPAALRGRMFEYHPYVQTFNRLKQLNSIGHDVSNVEIIIMGGTFPSTDLSYQEWFVSQILKAIVDFGLILDNIDKGNAPDFSKDFLENCSLYSDGLLKTYGPYDYVLLDDVLNVCKDSRVKCVGMTFETRPDWCNTVHVDRMLNMGATRVEIGVQTVHDEIYDKVKRGHNVSDSVNANQIIRDSGLKVGMHFMLGLFQNSKQDIDMFNYIFSNENYMPDMIKIYPCLVTHGSELYDLWESGGYEPYSDDEAVDVIVKIKSNLPRWVRTMRIQRDIPSTLIEAGVRKSNLGELVYNRLEEDEVNCDCIRCRELGHADNISDYSVDDFKLYSESYSAVGGTEFFLSLEDEDRSVLGGYLRLRFPSVNAHREEISGESALLREIRAYDNLLKTKKEYNIFDENSFTNRLINHAEKIIQDNDKNEIIVKCGIGESDYYNQIGYKTKGPYMNKILN